MSEYKIHHHVNELITLLRKDDSQLSSVGAEAYADLLLKSIVPYASNQVGAVHAVKKLAESSPNRADFLKKYDELKAKNVRDLDALVCCLHKIGEDDRSKTFLARNTQRRMEKSGSTEGTLVTKKSHSGKLTSEELFHLRTRLLKSTSENPSSQTSLKAPCSVSSGIPKFPQVPDWVRNRANLTMDFVIGPGDCRDPGAIMGAIPLPSQEHELLEDLLFCLGGISGEHIVALPLDNPYDQRAFQMDETIDTSFKELIRRILPLCASYSVVIRFIEEKSLFEFGQVNQALSAAMRSIIKDYLVLVAQLEQQHRQGLLTLQKLWFYIQPTMQTMAILALIASSINSSAARGGIVLGLLHELTGDLTGDPKGKEIGLFLTQQACVPYFEILEKWIYQGIIADPFAEFLIEDNELVQKEDLPVDYSDDYWEKRYTVCHERSPIFLEKVAGMILRTGKYLNVIRQSGKDVKCPDSTKIVYTLNERLYVETIGKAYNFASKRLLDLLMEEKDMMGRLRSVKHYFLLDQGDFIVQFMDMAEEELKKNIDDIMPTRLESLLGLALRTSVVNNDPYKDDVRIVLLPYDLLSQMFKILSFGTKQEKDYQYPTEFNLSGLEALTFDYDVKWPLSLILNRKALACYQMLFRHLFYSKHVERLLCNVWICNKLAKPFPLSAARYYAPAFALRQRMLNFVQNLEYYMMIEVLEPNWHVFVTKLNSVSNVDDVLRCHLDFLDVCLKDCMLTSPDLLKIVSNLMATFVSFSNFILHVNKYFVDAEMSSMIESRSLHDSAMTEEEDDHDSLSPDAPSATHTLTAGESFEQKISAYDAEFSKYLVLLLDGISDVGRVHYNVKLLNILYRVNFNSFYTDRLEKYAAERSLVNASASSSQKRRPPIPPKSSKLTSASQTTTSE